ncbi:hypothetical protein NQZ68_022939 [Dissostichus eleginoides]|nr:hypothetical protein NQZ68_022939 [Dissostichus eleginoides]
MSPDEREESEPLGHSSTVSDRGCSKPMGERKEGGSVEEIKSIETEVEAGV